MRYEFSLFITGFSSQGEKAINNLKRIFDAKIDEEYDLNVVDILEAPEIAEKEKIIASPTLILNNSRPSRRIIGNFSDQENFLKWLNAPEKTAGIE